RRSPKCRASDARIASSGVEGGVERGVLGVGVGTAVTVSVDRGSDGTDRSAATIRNSATNPPITISRIGTTTRRTDDWGMGTPSQVVTVASDAETAGGATAPRRIRLA